MGFWDEVSKAVDPDRNVTGGSKSNFFNKLHRGIRKTAPDMVDRKIANKTAVTLQKTPIGKKDPILAKQNSDTADNPDPETGEGGSGTRPNQLRKQLSTGVKIAALVYSAGSSGAGEAGSAGAEAADTADTINTAREAAEAAETANNINNAVDAAEGLSTVSEAASTTSAVGEGASTVSAASEGAEGLQTVQEASSAADAVRSSSEGLQTVSDADTINSAMDASEAAGGLQAVGGSSSGTSGASTATEPSAGLQDARSYDAPANQPQGSSSSPEVTKAKPSLSDRIQDAVKMQSKSGGGGGGGTSQYEKPQETDFSNSQLDQLNARVSKYNSNTGVFNDGHTMEVSGERAVLKDADGNAVAERELNEQSRSELSGYLAQLEEEEARRQRERA